MGQTYLTFGCRLQTFYKQYSSNLLSILKKVWAIRSFLFRGCSMYGWNVTVACPRIDGVGPNLAVIGQQTSQVCSCKTKYSSAHYSSSKLQWSGGTPQYPNWMDCYVLFLVVSVRLLMVSEHQWLTLRPQLLVPGGVLPIWPA